MAARGGRDQDLSDVREKAPLLAYGGLVLWLLVTLLAFVAWIVLAASGDESAAKTVWSLYTLGAFPLVGLLFLTAYVLYLPGVYRRARDLLSATVRGGSYDGRRSVVVAELVGTVVMLVGFFVFSTAYGLLADDGCSRTEVGCRPVAYETRNQAMPFVTAETAFPIGVTLVVVSGAFYAIAYAMRDSGEQEDDGRQHVTDRF